MAAITSFGVHQPAGLRYAIDEGILPVDPSPDLYTWEINLDTESKSCQEDELLTTETCVIWSRGGLFRKSFKFDLEKEPVTQALLAYFPASADNQRSHPNGGPSSAKSPERPSLSRALVVFLKTQAHIYFLSGASHVVHMPFEVESACAAPVGVIIQRKSRTENAAPVSLRLPKVPPNSFITTQASPLSLRNPRVPEFSTESLGNPKVLPLRLSLTLENMWQVPLGSGDSNWPRLVCLTDPLQEIGLVVTQQNKTRPTGGRRSSAGTLFLSPADEILHVQSVNLSGVPDESKLIIAVTVNRETNMYTVWRLTYIDNEDPFVSRKKKVKG